MEDITGGLAPQNREAAGTGGPTVRIGKEQCQKFTQILNAYKSGKKALESRIINAEQWWKLRHWESIRAKNPGDPEPASGWLVNTILSKHSDAMDAYPEPLCLAREEGDKQEAKMLSNILPVVLEQNEFEKTWSDVWWYKLKGGTGVYGVFWDSSKLGGLGDIAVVKQDILNLFWQPGVDDIQKSRYIFCVNLVDNDVLEEQYPALHGQLGGSLAPQPSKYVYDESIPTSDKSAVVDVYYKSGGLLHYCKYVGEIVLFATENEENYRKTGLYQHGLYPFVFDPLFPEEGYPGCGYGYVDLCKDPQKTVDILNNCFVKSAVAASSPRWFVRKDGGINEEEYADLTKPFVHVTGRVDTDSVQQILVSPMPSEAVNYMQLKIDEIKQVSGNRDVNNGSTSSSVTAASAIAALQEAGNGLSRDMISGSYRAFRQVINLCIELIRQFYTVPRKFRILGQHGIEQYVQYTNAGIQPVAQGKEYGVDMGMRLPVFDIQVECQKESQYTKSAYNELAVQLYQLGVFNPQNAVMALPMLEMMDFKGRDELIQKIQANGSLQQQLMMWQQMAVALAQKYEPGLVEGLAQQAGAGTAPVTGGDAEKAGQAASGENTEKEHAYVKKARQRAQDSSQPR